MSRLVTRPYVRCGTEDTHRAAWHSGHTSKKVVHLRVDAFRPRTGGVRGEPNRRVRLKNRRGAGVQIIEAKKPRSTPLKKVRWPAKPAHEHNKPSDRLMLPPKQRSPAPAIHPWRRLIRRRG